MRAFIQEVIGEYKLLPNNALPSREMAEEIVELRVMCYQGGMPWPFKEKDEREHRLEVYTAWANDPERRDVVAANAKLAVEKGLI